MNILNTFLRYKLYFILIGFIVFALLIGSFGISYYKQVNSFKTWKSNDNGVRIESKIKQSTKTKRVKGKVTTTIKYTPYIKYSYSYEGLNYENDKISNSTPTFTTEADAISFLEDFPYILKVYFNPKSPKESYLKLNTSQTPAIIALSISALLLILAILLFTFKDSTFVRGMVFLR